MRRAHPYTKGMAKPVDAVDTLFDEAVAAIYAAGQQPAHRRRALSLVAQLLGAAGAVYLAWEDTNSVPSACDTAGILPANFAALYVTHGAAIDPRPRFFAAAHGTGIYVSHYDRDPTDPRDAAFFDGFLGPCGIGESIAAQISGAEQRRHLLTVERARGNPPFAPEEIRLFRRFVLHWRQADAAAKAARQEAAGETLARRLLDIWPIGAIVADKNRRVIFANAAAREILADGDGLSLADDRLQAARAFETNALTTLLHRASSADSEDAAGLLVARGEGKRPLALLVAPLEPSRAADDIGAPPTIVLIGDPDRPYDALAPRLTELFGLSRAEARVAAGIAEGLRLQEIARATGVRMPTVRTQLRAALCKIGAARQADLVRIALALPSRRAERPPPSRAGRIKSPGTALI